MVLGALFGVLFSVGTHTLRIEWTDGAGEQHEQVIEAWDSLEIVDPASDGLLAAYGPRDQAAIIAQMRRLHRPATVFAHWIASGEGSPRSTTIRKFERVSSMEKVPTIATWIKPVGTLFIRLLMFVAIPLVISSLIVGASSLGDLRKVGRIGAKTIVLYMSTTVVAITIGLVLVNLVEPGRQLSPDSSGHLMAEFQGSVEERIQEKASLDLVDTLVEIVPTNPLKAMAEGNMLQVVFFALLVGVSLTVIDQDKAGHVIGFFDGLSDVMIRIVGMIMHIAPYGVFALIAATVAEFGFEILGTLGWYAATLLLGFLLHLFGTIALMVRVLGRMSPVYFFRSLRQVMLIAFSSSSSAATLPVTMEACERRLGISKRIASFVLPLGATINMDGTSMYQAVAAVFIAQVYGLDLALPQQVTILLTAVLASIGTAPVPGVGIVMLIIVLRSVGIPEEGIALILGVDRILDMCRTVLNVSGDAAVATVIARQEGEITTGGLQPS
jgi:proton glutamate symport protein